MLFAAALLAGLALLSTVALVGVRSGASSARLLTRPASSAGGSAALPVALRGLVSGTLGRSERVFWVSRAGAGFVAANRAQGFSATFSHSGVRVSARGGRLALSLTGVGYGSSLRPLGSRAPTAEGNRVSYAGGPLVQWFENGPLGLEQGFTLRTPPAGAARGPVTIALRVEGSLRSRLVDGGEAVDFIAPGGAVVLRYVGLRAIGARGRVLHAWLDASGGTLLVRVDARDARYPLRIDPFVQQGSKLGGVLNVALSDDGNTALVGNDGAGAGGAAALVFTRSGTTWTQQGPALTLNGATGPFDYLPYTVAMSGDGNTALVGDVGDNDLAGAVWVFTRSATTWTQQGPPLVGTGTAPASDVPGQSEEGQSVALSDDGNTALVSGIGQVWVFTRSGASWTQQGPVLSATSLGVDYFDSGVALSGDGNTAIVGFQGGTSEGALVLTRSGTTWTQQGPPLVGTGAVGASKQGISVALSRDGNTALVGGPGPNYNTEGETHAMGAAWVFTRSGTTWTQQGPKLVGTGAVTNAEQGSSVALSADGNTAAIGGPWDDQTNSVNAVGAAWVFTRSGTTWTQQGPKLVAAGAGADAALGRSVALSGNGSTVLVGGLDAQWVFVMQPSTSSSAPPSLPPPVLGKAVNVTPVSGTVLIKLPPGAKLSLAYSAREPLASASLSKGSGFIPLAQARQIPVGSILDTTRGVIGITTATSKKNALFTGTFAGGIFELLQSRKQKGLTQLNLMDSHPRKKVCVSAGKKASAAKSVSSKVLGELKSTVHGSFTTRGSYSAATARGTQWSITDECAGTLTRVTRDVVSVQVFATRRAILVHAGHSYLARATAGKRSPRRRASSGNPPTRVGSG